MEQRSSDGNSHPFNLASPNPGPFDLLVLPPNLELQEGNYLGNNEEPSSLDSFPPPTFGLATQEPGQSYGQAMRPNQPATSNTISEQAWKIGGNHSDQSWPIAWPQTPFPHSAMGLGVGHGAPNLTHQQEENQVICNQTNPYEASSGSVAPQQAMPFWAHGMFQQQINDQVLMGTSNASIDAAVDISMLLPEPSVAYWKSPYPGQHVQPNQHPILDADPQSHDSTMRETSMMIGPQYPASYQQVNQAPFIKSFVNEADAGMMLSPPGSSKPQSPLGFSNEAPPVIPKLNPEQSQFRNPEMMDGITQEQSQPWLNLGPANSSSQPQGSGRIINSVYDPMYETLGLPIDPHLRMLLASQGGNPSSSRHNATCQSNSELQPWRLPDK